METQEPPPTPQHFFDLITPQPHHCMAVFVGSALQGRDIGMHQEMGQRCPYIQLWYPYILESCCVHYRNISDITTEGSTWALTMLATMCFQFSILNIYHPYGYHHLKGTAIMLVIIGIWYFAPIFTTFFCQGHGGRTQQQ
jgi:hypothetical protein